MSEIEKLRSLLTEAQKWLCVLGMPVLTEQGEDRLNALRDRIDAALAAPPESVPECQTCALSKAFHDVAIADRNAAWGQLTILKIEVERLQAEVRKQVFGSRVVFDREVVERAQLASTDPLEWPEGKRP